jgi:hypothetical protein
MEEMEAKKAKEILDAISQPCPIDDADNICVHIVPNTGKKMLVSIPDNEREEDSQKAESS